MSIQPGGVGMNPGGTTADIAAQMAAVTSNDQTATHPVWNAGDPIGQLYDMMDLPEDMTGVAQEPDEATEDAAFIDPADVGQMATGIPDADDLIPTFGPIRRL